MIFTTAPTPYRAVPSPLFKEKGDSNGYPGSVTQSRTTGFLNKDHKTYAAFRGAIHNHVLACATLKVGNFPTSNIHKLGILKILPSPQVGLTFNKVTNEIEESMGRLGFILDSFGKS